VRGRERRVRIVLAYDGTDYSGWQVQPRERTVQGTLQEVLGRVNGGAPVPVRGAGRTDAGVHAMGQVADGMVRESVSDSEMARALGSMLPEDIRPVLVETVDPGFHSRRDAVSKTYVYVLDRSEHGDPFRSRYVTRHPHAMDTGAVQDAIGRLPGRRDWSGFAGSACPPGNRVRTLGEASLDLSHRNLAVFRFTADGFLNHMVRNLVGTLLEVGRGRFEPSRIDRILESGDRTLAGPTAPARGLSLLKVRYEGFPEAPLPGDPFPEG
jgi:tRNA pseudouridine38-40 synthase